ncbi:PREDICTED: zinc finger FYVE domain-containing protein 1-like [Vollenhovia emeryi]|uniref:zinc finger FYVE domain-containing protein 1-like n=1 Tax=Vollenhovia emeryi TaxID=411798 RepID=UPI0005F541C7|nr:PREDICTED: zinc finger FYVE domain-containing protein 1-like [Vollenhovia emeryi]XP_011877496.1 PREDICTED: zinc finger FYVE domain-containing protein 1-like [Vollenhovia emeryi]XP_011877497.1 PREDICTED: zinc finger FYVE domain-containing protein 1-like [Vollenhovia emeryi]
MSTEMWKPWGETLRPEPTDSAIMKSLDSNLDNGFDKLPELNADLIIARKGPLINSCTKCHNNNNRSFLLFNGWENLQVSSAEEFLRKLNCTRDDTRVKVVSIFGNTDDGKSHTMNQMFFRGEEVFQTSNDQNCCTLGIWAAFDSALNVVCLDTEGLQGITASCEDVRTRLLLKVLAVSDVVIYGIHSERLNRDLFTFLGAASRAYSHRFKVALQAIGQREGISTLSTLGPSVIVLHETRHTIPLINNGSESAEDILRARFAQMNLEIDAFSSIKYVGLQAVNDVTDYGELRSAIENELNNTTVRSARNLHLVYNTLKRLHDELSSENENLSYAVFPEQYFTCPAKCLSCDSGCNNSMGHLREGKPHSSNTRCKFQCQYENSTYICKRCYKNGNEVEVNRQYYEESQSSWYSFAKNAWSGYVIKCPHCGEIYKSRQYWYGNNPEDVAVRKKITHVWNTSNRSIAPQNTAQRVIDSVSYITEAVTNASLQPTRALRAWAADQVAPSYWRPNNEIKYCYQCKVVFSLADDKHHCRDCGEGFCAQCSSKTKCVPNRNWHSPVRVCDTCYERETNCSSDDSLEPAEDVGVRKVTEHVVSTLNAVGTVFTYSKSFIKDSVRPSYWTPDSEVVNCCVCERKFSSTLPLHHCRACGRGVCHECSQHRKPVPHRGWDHPVRVCNACV